MRHMGIAPLSVATPAGYPRENRCHNLLGCLRCELLHLQLDLPAHALEFLDERRDLFKHTGLFGVKLRVQRADLRQDRIQVIAVFARKLSLDGSRYIALGSSGVQALGTDKLFDFPALFRLGKEEERLDHARFFI